VAGDAPLLAIYVASAVNGLFAALWDPSRHALLPVLAEHPDELTAANVMGTMIDSVSFFAGPAMGAALLAVASPQAVLVVLAAAFALSGVLVAGLPDSARLRLAR
jgi:hypothetical protein